MTEEKQAEEAQEQTPEQTEEAREARPEDLVALAKSREEQGEWVTIPGTGLKVYIVPAPYEQQVKIRAELERKTNAKRPREEIQLSYDVAWVAACLAKPKMDRDHLAHVLKAMPARAAEFLVFKCREVSGDLPRGFTERIEQAKNSFVGEDLLPAGGEQQ